METKRPARGVGVGIASLVVIFAVLALTIFAVLSVSTASQEKKLSEQYAASVSAYWAADEACTEKANALGALWKSGATAEMLQIQARQLGADVAADGADLLISYSEPISDIASLQVTLRVGAAFEITEWRSVTETGDWSPDNSLPVWKG